MTVITYDAKEMSKILRTSQAKIKKAMGDVKALIVSRGAAKSDSSDLAYKIYVRRHELLTFTHY